MATKKPRRKYKPRPLQTWLDRSVRNDIEIMSFFFASKLASGTFDALDSNTMAYMLNVCHKIAVDTENDMQHVCDMAIEAYRGIRRRHDKTGKYGASGTELMVIRETMPEIASYFTTRPQHRLESARLYVLRVNEKMRQAGMLYAEPCRDGTLHNVEMAA